MVDDTEYHDAIPPFRQINSQNRSYNRMLKSPPAARGGDEQQSILLWRQKWQALGGILMLAGSGA